MLYAFFWHMGEGGSVCWGNGGVISVGTADEGTF